MKYVLLFSLALFIAVAPKVAALICAWFLVTLMVATAAGQHLRRCQPPHPPAARPEVTE